MSQRLTRLLPRCVRSLYGSECRRHLSDKRFVKADSTTQPLVNLEDIHKEWKSGGFFPRAPLHVAKHGAKCLQMQLTHARLNTHVFGGHDYRLSPLHATFADKHLDFGTLVAASQTALPPQVDWSSVPVGPDKKYTLVLYSPDCTNCKLHWWVSNISHSGDVTIQSDDVTTQSDDVTAQSDDVTTQSDDVTTQSDDVTTQSDDVTTQSDDVTTQLDDVTTQLDDVTTQSDDVTTQSDDVTTQSDDVTTQSDDVTTQSDDVTTQSGETVLPYVPAVPLKGTGFYRYVLVLLEQDPDSSISRNIDRLSELSVLIKEHKLLPVSLALFQASWDESVGPSLANFLGKDEQQFSAERPKNIDEFYAEERFLRKEWEMKTSFM